MLEKYKENLSLIFSIMLRKLRLRQKMVFSKKKPCNAPYFQISVFLGINNKYDSKIDEEKKRESFGSKNFRITSCFYFIGGVINYCRILGNI